MAAIQDKAAPSHGPVNGNRAWENNAYAPTLLEPNIMGPTAPAGTAWPCDNQRDAMEVRKIAGNTATIPATTGPKTSASQTAMPIALAAITPRRIRVLKETGLCPFGVGV